MPPKQPRKYRHWKNQPKILEQHNQQKQIHKQLPHYLAHNFPKEISKEEKQQIRWLDKILSKHEN